MQKMRSVSASLCVGKGADSLFYSDYSLAGYQEKKNLKKKHEENLLLPQIERSRT